MAKLSTKHSSATHRIIIYGGPKSGKTLLAGKLSEFYDLLWFDLENGHETLFQLPESWQERIELIDIPDTRSYPIAIETCLKVVKGPVDICETHGKVSCMICKKDKKEFTHTDLPAMNHNQVVVFDSLTQLSNSAIAHITRKEPDDYKLTYNDWGNLGKLLDIFLSHIQQAGYNVIVISHETEAETEGKKSVLVPVGGTRNFSRNIAKYFDHVIYAERKNKKHVFSSSSQYSTTILTGSRTDVRIEDQKEGEEASLLPIFKPELYDSLPPESKKPVLLGTKTKKPLIKAETTSKAGGGDSQTKDILARLKKKVK